jgi:hypothetical protein
VPRDRLTFVAIWTLPAQRTIDDHCWTAYLATRLKWLAPRGFHGAHRKTESCLTRLRASFTGGGGRSRRSRRCFPAEVGRQRIRNCDVIGLLRVTGANDRCARRNSRSSAPRSTTSLRAAPGRHEHFTWKGFSRPCDGRARRSSTWVRRGSSRCRGLRRCLGWPVRPLPSWPFRQEGRSDPRRASRPRNWRSSGGRQSNARCSKS